MKKKHEIRQESRQTCFFLNSLCSVFLPFMYPCLLPLVLFYFIPYVLISSFSSFLYPFVSCVLHLLHSGLSFPCGLLPSYLHVCPLFWVYFLYLLSYIFTLLLFSCPYFLFSFHLPFFLPLICPVSIFKTYPM